MRLSQNGRKALEPSSGRDSVAPRKLETFAESAR